MTMHSEECPKSHVRFLCTTHFLRCCKCLYSLLVFFCLNATFLLLWKERRETVYCGTKHVTWTMVCCCRSLHLDDAYSVSDLLIWFFVKISHRCYDWLMLSLCCDLLLMSTETECALLFNVECINKSAANVEKSMGAFGKWWSANKWDFWCEDEH